MRNFTLPTCSGPTSPRRSCSGPWQTISGGIAAFKAAGLVSQLRQKGADVHCIMTANAAKLVTPITFGELSGNDVTVDMFANISKWDVEHIALAQLADLFVVAPATADIIGKVANGIAWVPPAETMTFFPFRSSRP